MCGTNYVFKGFNISVGPDDAKLCKGMNTTFNCGYFFINFLPDAIPIPQWIINGTTKPKREIDNDPDDLLQWIVDGDDTNTTRLLVGPVDERFVGTATFQCEIPTTSRRQSRVATLTVIGKLSDVEAIVVS